MNADAKTLDAVQDAQAVGAEMSMAELLARLAAVNAEKDALKADQTRLQEQLRSSGARDKNASLQGMTLEEALEKSGLKGHSLIARYTLVDPAGKEVGEVFKQTVEIALKGSDKQNGNKATQIGAHFQGHPLLNGHIALLQCDVKIEKVGKRG